MDKIYTPLLLILAAFASLSGAAYAISGDPFFIYTQIGSGVALLIAAIIFAITGIILLIAAIIFAITGVNNHDH